MIDKIFGVAYIFLLLLIAYVFISTQKYVSKKNFKKEVFSKEQSIELLNEKNKVYQQSAATEEKDQE